MVATNSALPQTKPISLAFLNKEGRYWVMAASPLVKEG